MEVECAVPENIHTPPTEGIGISWGVGGSVRPKNLKKCRGGGGGSLKKSLPCGSMDIFWNNTMEGRCHTNIDQIMNN